MEWQYLCLEKTFERLQVGSYVLPIEGFLYIYIFPRCVVMYVDIDITARGVSMQISMLPLGW